MASRILIFHTERFLSILVALSVIFSFMGLCLKGFF